MARSSFQKLKLLHVRNYLLQNSDEEHPVTVHQMIQYLASNGIAAERKSIYDDIEALRTFGMDIEECKRGRVFGYCVASRTFELPELKLLVDSVQSSKFITHKKTGTLIHKLESLASVHQARQLQRQTRAVLPVMQSRGIYLVAQDGAPSAEKDVASLTYALEGDALQAEQNYAIAEYYVRRIHPAKS